MKRNVLFVVAALLLVAVAISSCGTASSIRRNSGCPSTRYSIGY